MDHKSMGPGQLVGGMSVVGGMVCWLVALVPCFGCVSVIGVPVVMVLGVVGLVLSSKTGTPVQPASAAVGGQEVRRDKVGLWLSLTGLVMGVLTIPLTSLANTLLQLIVAAGS